MGGTMFQFPDILKNHPIVVLAAGVILGAGSYEAIIRVAQLEVVPQRSSCSKGEVSVRVESYPSEASVELLETAKTFVQGICLAQGRYKIRVAAPGHKPQTRTIHLGTSNYTAVFQLD